MSSSNLVRLALIEEVSYGITPGSGNFKTARFTSEALSGTPNTVESKQLRTDRMSSGQVVVGLQVAGDMKFELAKESALDLLLASAMYSDWVVSSLVTVDLSIDATLKTITRATGSYNSPQLKVGDILTLAGFSNAANNTQVMVAEITSATVIKYVGTTLVTEVGTGTSYKCADKLTIGTTKKSFSLEKSFTDLTTKAINYTGMIVSALDLKFAYGALSEGSFSFMGNGYAAVSAAVDFLTYSRTVDAAATSQSLNGSIDMPFLASSALGVLDTAGIDLQSVGMKMANNLTAITTIGELPPKDYSAGTAQISMDLVAYLSNEAWSILGKKLTQDPFALGFMVKNSGGWYGFYLPQIQVSFPDPVAAGQNQNIMLNMTGQAKVGASGESALTIYRS